MSSLQGLLRMWIGEKGPTTCRRRIRTVQATLDNEQLVKTKELRSLLEQLDDEVFFDKYKPENSMTRVEIDDIDGITQRIAA